MSQSLEEQITEARELVARRLFGYTDTYVPIRKDSEEKQRVLAAPESDIYYNIDGELVDFFALVPNWHKDDYRSFELIQALTGRGCRVTFRVNDVSISYRRTDVRCHSTYCDSCDYIDANNSLSTTLLLATAKMLKANPEGV